MSLRYVTIVRDETGDGVRVTSRTGSARKFVGDLKKVKGVGNLTPNEEVQLLGLAEARRICAPWVPHEIGAR